MRTSIISLVVLAACAADTETPSAEHDARFIGLWAVEQPYHAAYEVTYYDFTQDGTVSIVGSTPSVVTGTVAHCIPAEPTQECTGDQSCEFGTTWFSRDAATLVIIGVCSDGVDREIELAFAADSSSNTGFGGGGATLASVGGETDWSHATWDWAFRKCETGADPDACAAF